MTAALWLAYLYLISDVFRVSAESLLWLGGYAVEPEELRAILAFIPTLGHYAVIVAVNAVLLLAWAQYNRVRFRGKDRRRPMPGVTLDDFAAMYDVQVAEIAAWQSARILVVHHDETGKLTAVEMPPNGLSGLVRT